MSRTLAVLLALVAAAGVSQLDRGHVVAQDKKKDKKKDKAPTPAGEAADDLAKVLPVFDPGTHTRTILAMGFTTDAAKLVTVGRDYTVQVWGATTGERLDVFRLPGYGHEKGFNPGHWNVAAVSADGNRVVLGGEAKALAVEDGTPADTRLVLLDIPTRTMRRVQIPGNGYVVEAAAFAPDGNTLAVAIDRGKAKQTDLVVIGGLTQRLAGAGSIAAKDCPKVETPHAKGMEVLAFSPDGRKLLAGGRDRVVSVWDVPAGGAAPRPVLEKEIPADGQTVAAAWAPDGKRFLRFGYDGGDGTRDRVLEYRDAGGDLIARWSLADLAPALTKGGRIRSIHFLTPDAAYLVANGYDDGTAYSVFTGTRTSRFDLTTGKATLLAGHPTDVPHTTGAMAPGGKLVAATTDGNTDIVITRPEPGAPVVRCGARTPVPHHVGWAADPAGPGFAWGADRQKVKKGDVPTAGLTAGFDLVKVEPAGGVAPANYVPARRKLDGWVLDTPRGDGVPYMTLTPPGKGDPVKMPGANVNNGRTLIPNPGGPPRVAYATRTIDVGDQKWLFGGDGTRLTRLLPDVSIAHDVASSPDGRYVVASTGTPRITVHRTDGTAEPFLSFAQLNGEWVCWTAEGYYAASPGGEKMFGFAVNNGPNALVTFHPADRFAKHFRRPDVIKLAVEKGSVKAALEALNAKAPAVESILPPDARLALVGEPAAGRVRVRAKAEPRGVGKPVLAMRVLLDGRPLPNGVGVWTPGPTENEFEVDVPPGQHELKLLARSADGSAVSDPVVVRGPKAAGPPQTLYRVCVGIDAYDQTGLKLATAAKDARDVFDALARHCVGPDNRYAAAAGELVLDKDATRARVKQALEETGRRAKPGDLMVVFFAGHGVKKADAFYLLTRESDPAADLNGQALSADDLRAALAGVECPVLLALDACHSAGAVPTLRGGADDLTRAMTDDAVGVTVLSAAMAHETAGAAAGNGHFTAGLLKGLAAGAGVPFDPYERAVYIHHLYSVVFAEVRRATDGRQNPFLNMPWTAPPLAVRDVPRGLAP
jgi:WD40 repeat protein